MAGEKLVQKALQAAMEARAAKHVADPAERAANLARFMEGNNPNVPPVVYHASKADVTSFDPRYKTELSPFGFHFGTADQANFRTGQYDFQSGMPNVGKYHLSMKNPLEVTHMGSYAPDHLAEQMMDMGILKPERYDALVDKHMYDPVPLGNDLVNILKKNGYDGLMYQNEKEGAGYSFVPFDAFQSKSATGNLGTFDPAIPRLTEAHGGEVREHHADGKLVGKALQAVMEARAKKHVADPAKRAENLAKWQAQTPKEVAEPRWYHGTKNEIETFLPLGQTRSTFVTQNPSFANLFAAKDPTSSLAQPNVMPLHVRAENPFDYENPDHVAAVINAVRERVAKDPSLHPGHAETIARWLHKGDWNLIEGRPVQQALKELGHDAFFVHENGNKNLAVFDPAKQLKSATGNLGTFDPKSPRLDENRGGEVREHHADGERVGMFDIRAVDPAFGENSLTTREGSSLPRAVQLARSIIDAQPSLPAQGAPVDMSLSPQFAGMAHAMGKTPIGAVSVPVMGGNLHLQGGYDPLTKFEHYGARYTRPFADGGAARGHYLFGGDVEYQSNSEPLIKDGVINWGDPENAADFFRAAAAMQRATELAKQVESSPAPMPQPVRRPEPSQPRVEAPAPAPAPAAEVKQEEPAPTSPVAPPTDYTLGGGYRFVPTSPDQGSAAMRPDLNPVFGHNQPILGQLEAMMPPMNLFEAEHPLAPMVEETSPLAPPAEELPKLSTQEMLALLPPAPQTAPQAIQAAVNQAKITDRLPQEATAYAPVPNASAGNSMLRAIRGNESNNNPNAQNPRSSAGGLYQFLDTTWGSVLRRMDPQRYGGMTDAQLAALKKGRDTVDLQERAAEFHLNNDIAPALARAGIPLTPGTAYLGWFQGPAGVVRAMTAPSNATVAEVFPKTVSANANMRFRGKPYAQWTMNDLRQWAETSMARRMGRSEGGEVEREAHGSGERVVGKALDVIREKLAAGRALPEEQRMIATHNAGPNAIKFYSEIGGLPAPSIGIFKPVHGAERFGEVKLIGKPEAFAVPSAENPIFAADAYTPRLNRAQRQSLAEVAEREGRSPLDVYTEWLRMNGTRGGETGVGGSGYIRSMIAPEFKTLDELQGARDLLVHKSDLNLPASSASAQYQTFLEKMRQQPYMRGFSVADFAEAASHGPDWFSSRYHMASPEMHSRFREYIEHLQKMPTEYFEGKPQRAVRGEDFAGALVQEGSSAASTAKDLERLGIGNIKFYKHAGELGNPQVQSELLFKHFPEQMFAQGGGVQHFDKGGSAFRKYVAKLVGHTDAPTKRIEDWQWRPLSDVATELELTKIPPHVRNFGDYMRDMSDKAAKEGLSARDLIKGYTTTRASIQRRATDADRLRQLGLDLPSDVTTIRPEGAWAEWLMTPMGKRYLDAASKGTVEGDAVADAIKIMSPFGRHETDIPDAMKWAAENLPGREKAASDLVARAAQGASSPAEWRQFTADIRGVGPSKSGFLASLYGRGDQPTLDARQIILNTGAPTKEAARYIARGGGEGGVEAVERLAARQQALGLQQPSKYDPFYQHLAHHAIWDKASNEMTTHGDVVRAMREADGGPVLADKYPTHYLPNVGRQVMQDGGVPPEVSMTRARKLALEEIGKSEDKPPMDPAVMGQNWANAVRRFRVPDYAVYEKNEPRRDPSREEFARPLELGARDVIGGAIAGDEANRTYLTELRRRAADAIVGSTGLPGSGTVGFGLADLPMVTGIPLTVADIGQSVREGDYLGAGAGAALPAAFYARKPLMDAGRRALEIAREYAPQLATAAGVGATLTSGDAEAAKAKAVQQAVNIVRTAERPPSSRFVSQAGEHGYFVPQSARERDPRLWHPISNTVLSRPLGEMQAEYAITTQPTPRKFITPQELEGAALIPALGDRTAGNALLRRVNEIDLPTPTEMQAGHSFMFGPAARGADFSAWASDPGVIAALANKTRKAAEAGYDPYLSYVAMGSRAGDYSHHMTDTLLGMLQSAKVPKATIAEFDRQMRENVANKWDPYTDFPGLKSKDLEAYLYGAGPAKARTKMAELMGQGQFQKAGMPDVGAARFAITDPALLHAADYSAGHSITKLDPTGRVIKEPAVPHKTYKVQLGADPEKGYVGGFEYDIPFSVMNKEWIDKLMAVDPKKYSNPSMLAYTYRMHQPTTIMTPEVVDRLSKYLENKKRGLIP